MTNEQAIKHLYSMVITDKDNEAVGIAVKVMDEKEKTGKWVKVTSGRGGHECSKCFDYAPCFQNGEEYLSRFCPMCGVRMGVRV